MMRWRRRRRITRFEQAYCDLYNSRISAAQFAQAAGIEDPEQAWKQLCEYRRQVIDGIIPDPRTTYDLWDAERR